MDSGGQLMGRRFSVPTGSVSATSASQEIPVGRRPWSCAHPAALVPFGVTGGDLAEDGAEEEPVKNQAAPGWDLL